MAPQIRSRKIIAVEAALALAGAGLLSKDVVGSLPDGELDILFTRCRRWLASQVAAGVAEDDLEQARRLR